MLRFITVLFLAVMSLVSQGCQSSGAGRLSDREEAQLSALSDRWERAANSRDSNALAATYTPDAVLLPPNSPAIVGRDNIKQFFAGFPPFSDMSLKLVEIEGRGDMAYVRGVYSMTIHLPDAGPVHDRGKYLEIRERLPDGTWLISHDMYSSDLPAAP